MMEIYVEHNPYKPLTKIFVDGELVKENSALNHASQPFQEWVEELPAELRDECADDEFHITFHGTILDFEDLQSVSDAAQQNGIYITCTHEPAKEVQDKEAAIDEIFQEIANNNYFEELKSPDMIAAFKLAKGKEFPVNVIATMSSGKSTLINALLGYKLMPAQQEACTATITELHDNDEEHFVATAYGADDIKLSFKDPLTASDMEILNKDSRVSKIVAYGDIPFVRADDVSLVLVDTPGPNNARNNEHRVATFRMLSESSKPLVLYVLNAGQLAINDDNSLLNQVAETMRVGGKQSKDRYIFVLNKLDDFKSGEDSVDSAIQKAKEYLADKGIENPNIFPASALAALEIRFDFKDVDYSNPDPYLDDNDDFEFSKARVKRLNNKLHLDEYAPLTPSVNAKIMKELADARESGDIKAEALIHSGIRSIEEAIKVYVEKYAKTAKIRGIVNTFAKRLESQKSFERTRQQIAENQERKDEIKHIIQITKKKIEDGKAAAAFEKEIRKADLKKEVSNQTDKLFLDATEAVTKQLEDMGTGKISKAEAERRCADFVNYVKNLQAKVRVDVENTVNTFFEAKSEELVNRYIQRLKTFAEDATVSDIDLNPVQILMGDVSSINDYAKLIAAATTPEKVKVDQEWIKNYDKKWYKPWTWFQESGHWRDVYEDQEFVGVQELAEMFLADIKENLYLNKKEINKSTQKQSEKIVQEFSEMFKNLDDALKAKFAELEKCTSEEAEVDDIIMQTTERLNWLTGIQNRVSAILEI